MCETADEVMEMIIREQTLKSKEELDLEIANNMIKLGYPTKLIAEITYIDILKIKQLRLEIMKNPLHNAKCIFTIIMKRSLYVFKGIIKSVKYG